MRPYANTFDVMSAMWVWRPGEHADWTEEIPNPRPGGPYRRENTEKRAAWEKWAKKHCELLKLVMHAFSQNCMVISSDEAMSYMAVSTLAMMIERSIRQTQRILRQLELSGDLVHTPCDGSCGNKNHSTDHWIIPRPKRAPMWGEPRKPRGRPRKRGGGA